MVMMPISLTGGSVMTLALQYLHGQNSNLYLSLVYMWDKLYNSVFVAKKNPLPGHMAIGDIYNGDKDEGKEELGVNKGNDAIKIFSHLSMTNSKPRRSPGS